MKAKKSIIKLTAKIYAASIIKNVIADIDNEYFDEDDILLFYKELEKISNQIFITNTIGLESAINLALNIKNKS